MKREVAKTSGNKSDMTLALTGILSVFLPGMIGYGVVCWMMPFQGFAFRLFRALLVALVTCSLGFVGGYAFSYVRDGGPYHDDWHLELGRTMAAVQLAVGAVLGLVSLSPLSKWMRHDYEVLEKVRHKNQEAKNN